MAKKPNDWMPLDVRKYLGDTMHLGREQHGGYLLLIMAYWMRGGPLNDSDQELAAIVRASLPDWRRLRPSMETFFEVIGGKWVHNKIEKELNRAREIIGKKSSAGKIGAENRWRTNDEPDGKPIADAIADASQTDAPLPLPVPKKEKRYMPAGAGLDGFEDFWKAYKPTPNAKKPDGKKAWLAVAETRPPLPDILRAVAGYLVWLAAEWRKNGREFPAKQHPSTWLRGEVWNGYMAAGQAASAYDFAEVERQEAEHQRKKSMEQDNVH